MRAGGKHTKQNLCPPPFQKGKNRMKCQKTLILVHHCISLPSPPSIPLKLTWLVNATYCSSLPSWVQIAVQYQSSVSLLYSPVLPETSSSQTAYQLVYLHPPRRTHRHCRQYQPCWGHLLMVCHPSDGKGKNYTKVLLMSLVRQKLHLGAYYSSLNAAFNSAVYAMDRWHQEFNQSLWFFQNILNY